MPLPVTRKLTLRGLGSINANAARRAQLIHYYTALLARLGYLAGGQITKNRAGGSAVISGH
jgi:hypothetical protein